MSAKLEAAASAVNEKLTEQALGTIGEKRTQIGSPLTFARCWDVTRGEGEEQSKFSDRLCKAGNLITAAMREGRFLTGPEKEVCQKSIAAMQAIIDSQDTASATRLKGLALLLKVQYQLAVEETEEKAFFEEALSVEASHLEKLGSVEQVTTFKVDSLRMQNCIGISQLGVDIRVAKTSPIINRIKKMTKCMQECQEGLVALNQSLLKKWDWSQVQIRIIEEGNKLEKQMLDLIQDKLQLDQDLKTTPLQEVYKRLQEQPDGKKHVDMDLFRKLANEQLDRHPDNLGIGVAREIINFAQEVENQSKDGLEKAEDLSKPLAKIAEENEGE